MIFAGDVVAIGGGTIITADRVEVDQKNDKLYATGHVIILMPRQVFLGDNLTFHWLTGDFRITNALMVANDPKEVERISQKLLGFTSDEMAYEAKRQERIKELEGRKQELREEYRLQDGQRPNATDELVDAYALLLEQQDLTKRQENPALAKMSKSRRESFLVRRKYWEETVKEFSKAQESVSKEMYFRVSGDVIERTNGNDYRAYEANWTPCKCEEGETPPWGFASDRIEAQMEGYVDLIHPVFSIKGIPVLYLPYLKIPLKNQRQSGLLTPTFQTGSKKYGTVYTQPVFFAFAPNFDSTITTDIFQDRGTRLGAELRYEQRRHSGWTLNVDSIHDQVWIDSRNNRRDVFDAAMADPNKCWNQPDPSAECREERATFERDARRQLAAPSNTWRGKQEWRGQTFFAPRLSLVSHGTLVSDRRYIGDLSLGDSFEEIFNPGKYANSFSTARSRMHLDGRDFYLGLGSSFGDHALMETERFHGLQMPWHLSFQSRMFSVVPSSFILPVYGQASFQYIPIQDFSKPEDPETPILGSGEWRRANFSFVTPVVREGIVRVDQFTEFENRTIEHSRISPDTSWIQSWRTGLTLNLPLDGQAELPAFLQPKDYREPEKGGRYLHHIMNWALSFSARPSVVRRGPYGEIDPFTGNRQVYFASDRKVHDTADQAATVEESMVRHQRITLSTTHRWRLFRRGWRILEGIGPVQPRENQEPENFRQRARRELEFSMDRQIQSDREMFSEENGLNWFVNRYKLTDYDSQEPINFDANITYDFVQAEERQKALARNRELKERAAADPLNAEQYLQEQTGYPDLPRPWTGPNANLTVNGGGFSLTTQVEYDLYLRASRKVNFGIGLPEVYGVRLGGTYSLEKGPQFDKESDSLKFLLTRTRQLTLVTNLIPYVTTTASYALKQAGGEKEQYESRLGIEYYDKSECWGLRFLRSKDYGAASEREAAYLVQLTIIFMGQQRAFDASPALQKRIDENES